MAKEDFDRLGYAQDSSRNLNIASESPKVKEKQGFVAGVSLKSR
jgi:hypothetical protein